jgi:polysaccharide export outer membrane protein
MSSHFRTSLLVVKIAGGRPLSHAIKWRGYRAFFRLFLGRTRLALLIFVSAASGPAYAEYNVVSGDTLEVTVSGYPDLNRRAAVGIEGEIVIPLVGTVPVGGLPISSVRTVVSKLITEKLLEERSIVRVPTISVEVSEYRPFYIKGDVTKPGAYPYRHRMTIRHAVALAGGYGRPNASNPALSAIELAGEYETVRAEYVRNQARLLRLRAELEGRAEFDLKRIQDAETGVLAQQLAQIEARQLTISQAEHRNQVQHLNRLFEFTERQLSFLNQQQKEEQTNVDLQSKELERIKALFDKGFTPSSRLSDSQQSLALMKIRSLEHTVRAGEATQRKEEFSQALRKAVFQREIDLLEKVQDAVLAVERTSARLNGVREKLTYIGSAASRLSERTEMKPELMIFRQSSGAELQVPAEEATEVLPGDVVEVSITIQEPARR